MKVGVTVFSDPRHVEGVLKDWTYTLNLSEVYPDLRIEIEDRFKVVDLTSLERGVTASLIEDMPQGETAETLSISNNTV